MTTAQEIIILLPILLVSISIHEMMHALASFWLGDDTAAEGGRISLNPLKHIDPYLTIALPAFSLYFLHQLFAIAKPVMVNFHRLKFDEFGGAIVGVVGPLSNLLIASIGALIFHLVSPIYGSLTYNVLTVLVELNLVLFTINLIPWPPLDGSRVLFAFAPEPLQDLMVSIERAGISVLILFLIFVLPALWPLINHIINSLMASLGVPLPVI